MAEKYINPLREERPTRRSASACTIVVLGATGDLTSRKLLPALYNLARHGHLPSRYSIIGFARREKSDEEFRDDVFNDLNEFSRTKPGSREEADSFLENIYYHQGQLGEVEDFQGLHKRIEEVEEQNSLPPNRLFYFAISPEFFESTIYALKEANLAQPDDPDENWTRVIIEKPFGEDLKTARELNSKVQSVFKESQVYRIDHYLGKETVQNLLAFRFGNSIFEPLWSSRYIDHIQITMAEEVGMPGRRGQYFDKAGILRDVVQNHVLQLLCLTTMEPPASLDADSLRDEKVRVLRAIHSMTPELVEKNVVRGQYIQGSLRGEELAAYRDENLVDPKSVTETYVAMRLELHNWRWAGMPIFLRSGKRLSKRATEIAVVFKRPPHEIFEINNEFRKPNTLALRIQPDEGIAVTFAAKYPGLEMNLQPVQMDFRYGSSFGAESPEAYERLILDCLIGDGSLFTRADEVEEAWRICTEILEAWDANQPDQIPIYAAGSWGPKEADELMKDCITGWRRL